EERSALEAELAAAREALRSLERQVEQAAEERAAPAGEADALRREVARLRERDRELRRMVLDAHEQLLQRDDELAAALDAGAGEAGAADGGYLRYREIVARVHELVSASVPAGAAGAGG